MSEARSLTPLSETDYETIADAVMETARGRWFMTEFARRNRQADTAQLLGAIQRIERAVGVAAAAPGHDHDTREAAALIADLRLDLERIGGRGSPASSGLASRIETAASAILAAAESVQEASWQLREAGQNDDLCDLLDRRTTEVFAAAAVVEGTAQQIDKIGDTIAMLDSSLRAFAEREPSAGEDAAFAMRDLDPAPSAPLSRYADIDIVAVEAGTRLGSETGAAGLPTPLQDWPVPSIKPLADDIVFEDVDDAPPHEPVQAAAAAAPAQPEPRSARGSEADLHALDAMPADRKLAYFA